MTRVLGDLGVAEDAVSEAYVTALRVWPERGLPRNAGAWITTTARNHGLDRLRREVKRGDKERAASREAAVGRDDASPVLHPVADDQLRLLFTCCHPALAVETQVALTLRMACGLRTEEIARALLRPQATVAQRLTRAKRRIRTARIPFRIPDEHELHDRLAPVLICIELIYREGYAATGGASLVRRELCEEGLRLADSLATLLPGEPEALGLHSLLALMDARHATRVDDEGRVILLEDQDRTRWDRELITDAVATLERAAAMSRPGSYQLRAAIAAEHATAPTWPDTDWVTIAGLYARLARIAPSPVVELNRAVAIALAGTPEAGLAHLDTVAADERLRRTHLLPATRADLLRRLGRRAEAAEAYRAAIALAPSDPERRFLEGRLAALGARAPGGHEGPAGAD